MEGLILFIEKLVWSIPLVSLLMFTHIFFTLKLKIPQKYTFDGLRNMLKSDKSNTSEGISSFKSIMTVLAATLGTGNIIGVATAIILGGVGSIFWIFISGIFAISTNIKTSYAFFLVSAKAKQKNPEGPSGFFGLCY